jgi:hypothetical protein
MKLKKKDDQSVDASVLLRRGGAKYSQEEIWRQSVEQRLKKRLSRDCLPGDPFHKQPPNPEVIVDARRFLLTGA